MEDKTKNKPETKMEENENKNLEKKLIELEDPATVPYYEPNALKELNDGRIIFFTLKGNQIIVMSISLMGSESDIFIKIEDGDVNSIIQLKDNLVVYGTDSGLIDIITLSKNSYVSNQKIINENDYIIKLVELNDLNFVSIMKNNIIKLYVKKENKYENTKTIKFESNEYFLSGIESSINNNLLVISYSKFLFVDIYNEKILKEINANDKEENNKNNVYFKNISLFPENCLRYKNTIIVAGISQFYLIDCMKQEIIKKAKIENANFPCVTLTKFVGESFVTGSGFGEMMQYKLNEKGDDLIFICEAALYLDRVMTCVYSKCGRYIIGEYNGLVILSFY